MVFKSLVNFIIILDNLALFRLLPRRSSFPRSANLGSVIRGKDKATNIIIAHRYKKRGRNQNNGMTIGNFGNPFFFFFNCASGRLFLSNCQRNCCVQLIYLSFHTVMLNS